MSLSKFNWLIVYDDGEIVKVYTTYPDWAIEIANKKTGGSQPAAIIRGSYYRDDDAIDGD